eukprot:6179789-Pleurochrysis_carterae.AAC.3
MAAGTSIVDASEVGCSTTLPGDALGGFQVVHSSTPAPLYVNYNLCEAQRRVQQGRARFAWSSSRRTR